MVPTGTLSIISSPSRPVLFDPSPCRPRWALYSGLKRKWTSVLCCSLDSMMTSPPSPPSPPLGPPRGTYFSLRKARQPLPPSPAFTRILTSSMNIEKPNKKMPPACSCRRPVRLRGGLCACLDVDEFAHPSAIPELDHAGDFGEQGIVLAPTDVGARRQFGATLAEDDAAAGYQRAAEDLHAEPLRIGIAPIFGT